MKGYPEVGKKFRAKINNIDTMGRPTLCCEKGEIVKCIDVAPHGDMKYDLPPHFLMERASGEMFGATFKDFDKEFERYDG